MPRHLVFPPRPRVSWLSRLTGCAALFLPAVLPAADTPREFFQSYAANPAAHPNIPDVSRAGYGRSDLPLPTPPVVANVRDFGAKGDGSSDDSPAFAEAIAAAIQKGGGAVFIPSGTYRLTKPLQIAANGIVLRGEGRDKTVLNFPDPLARSLGPLLAKGKSLYSWSGGQIWIGPTDALTANGLPEPDDGGASAWENWRPGDALAAVQPAPAGTTRLTLDKPAAVRPGELVLLRYENPPDHSLLKHLAGHPVMENFDWSKASLITPPRLPYFEWPVEVTAVEGNTITLAQPLRVEIQPAWPATIHPIGNHVRESGVEHLTIQCQAPMDHKHLTNQGHNGIYLNRTTNCFVRDVEIRSAENGIIVASAKNCTVSDVAFTGPEQHHHTLACRVMSHDILFEKFLVDGPNRVKHGINTEWLSSGNVWRDGVMKKGIFDSHRALSFDSVRTNIEMHNDADGPGGANEAGPFLGRRIVHWNIRVVDSPRPEPGEYVYQPEGHPMGALVGITGVPRSDKPAPAMPVGDKGCLVVEGPADPSDLFVAQKELRGKNP